MYKEEYNMATGYICGASALAVIILYKLYKAFKDE